MRKKFANINLNQNFFPEGSKYVSIKGVCAMAGQHFGDLNEKWSVFGITTPSDDGKIQIMIENTTVMLSYKNLMNVLWQLSTKSTVIL